MSDQALQLYAHRRPAKVLGFQNAEQDHVH
jgi:hypothetical protein